MLGRWRKLHKKGFHYSYSWPNIIKAILSRRMKWEGYWPPVGGRSEMHREFRWGNTKERDYMLDLVINVFVILKCILKKWHDVDWIYVNQNRDRRRGFVNTVTKFWVYKMWRNLWLYEKILASQRGTYSVEWFSHCYSVLIFSHRILIVYTTFPNTGRGVASEEYSWCFCVISRIRRIAHQHPNPTI